MGLISLILGIAIAGLLVYLVERYIPMAEPFKILIRVVVIIIIILWLVQFFGVDFKLPRFR